MATPATERRAKIGLQHIATFVQIVLLFLHITACASETHESGHDTKLRFAVAADGHWGQPDTPFEQDYNKLIEALNRLHQEEPFDFVVFLGDLVHDRPDLLPTVKNALDRLGPPCFIIEEDLVDDVVVIQAQGVRQ
ncbi:metallophosphoesterase [Desulfatitalea alkaliphila]|uniref:Metallophosphoesterase n=1 Tax=Desulfatitalea alkaliphila TaxID=2929485 RepID=A0AA41UKA8_9BACT|nr:metallophosphoesterase [Desulfatitalea alkaliphila]MCJ8501252.1 metallophosphoesterase [Desulfatitalea alkaliphila]